MNDASYAAARERLQWFFQRDRAAQVGELGRTLVFEHGERTERATLLLHGLSASPRQFAGIAQALYARGHNVFVPRLPRHGHANRLSEALATMNAAQLEACASDSLEVVRGLGGRVTVAGFSLGGLLAAYLGQFAHVDRAVAISPFLGVSWLPNVFRLPLARWVLRRPNRFLWWDPFLRERQMPEHGYPRFATHAVAHGLTLAHEVMQAALQTAPNADELVLVVNPRDSAVNNRAILRLAERWFDHKPEAVTVHRLAGLPPLVHDIIEPKRYPHVAQRVMPILVEIIDR
ncbi:MAG TPA: alpha/beta fold hydrolase [Candidatus Baltobacteraceae bacterium]|nr:alpha/beta fold hydrolase [Candidatus Baltobacteraceae bacterium]